MMTGQFLTRVIMLCKRYAVLQLLHVC